MEEEEEEEESFCSPSGGYRVPIELERRGVC
jgi:hypothetical protein